MPCDASNLGLAEEGLGPGFQIQTFLDLAEEGCST